MGPPQLQSGGVDTWFAAALDAAKAIMAGERTILPAATTQVQHTAVGVLLRPRQSTCEAAALHGQWTCSWMCWIYEIQPCTR